MEEKIQIKNKYKKVLTNRNKECYIEKDKNLNYISKKKKKFIDANFIMIPQLDVQDLLK